MDDRRLTPADFHPTPPVPPRARPVPHVTQIHGTTIEDQWAWLRDPGYPAVTDPEILSYLTAENDYCRTLLDPHREQIETLYEELVGRIAREDASVPVRDGEWYYRSRFTAADEYRIHERRRGENGTWQIIVDENQLARGSEYFELGGLDVSDDGVAAYSTDTTGDERFEMRFRDVESGTDLPDRISDTIGEPVWIPGTSLLLYLELNPDWRPYRVRVHELGTPVADDAVLYEEPDDGFFVDVDLSQDRSRVIVAAGDHVTSEVRVCRCDELAGVIGQPAPHPTPLRVIATRRTGHEYHVDHARDRFFILTNDRHVNFRLVEADDTDPGETGWREIVPGREDVYLRSFTPFAGFIVLEERMAAVDRIVIRTYGGEAHEIAFPEDLHVAHPGENPEYDVDAIRLRYQSPVTPPTDYDYLVPERRLVERKVQPIPSGYDRSRYRTTQIMAPARDGARVPVSIVHRDDYPLDGTGFVHLYAYGAYGYGTPPSFSRNQLSLLDRGFAFAIAHVRGGDDMGYQWYLDGKLRRRWNTFTDFIDAAICLVDLSYSSPGQICISGGSAGGELVGVVVNEAPELWAAAVAHVPFVDVTTTMLDDSLPLTPMEWPEWGNPLASREDFDYIRSYSPYDNVGPHAYPPLFVTAGLSDPRVTYWEPAKWTARLRATKTDDNVLMLKTQMGAGHGGPSGRFEHLRETAEELSFLLLARDAILRR